MITEILLIINLIIIWATYPPIALTILLINILIIWIILRKIKKLKQLKKEIDSQKHFKKSKESQ